MHKIVISDTSTLILFDKINEFDLLKKVYGQLTTTPEIAEEFVRQVKKHKNILLRQMKSKRIDISLYPGENTAADVLRIMRNRVNNFLLWCF